MPLWNRTRRTLSQAASGCVAGSRGATCAAPLPRRLSTFVEALREPSSSQVSFESSLDRRSGARGTFPNAGAGEGSLVDYGARVIPVRYVSPSADVHPSGWTRHDGGAERPRPTDVDRLTTKARGCSHRATKEGFMSTTSSSERTKLGTRSCLSEEGEDFWLFRRRCTTIKISAEDTASASTA